MPPLTPRQKRFAEEYISDLNATQAYIRAGYSGRRHVAEMAGSRMLKLPQVKEEVARLQADRSARVRLTADDVLRELKLLVLSDIEHYELDDNGRLVVSPDAPPGARRAVSKKKFKRRTIQGAKPVENPDGTWSIPMEIEAEITLWDKVSAMRMAMEHFGLSKQLTLEVILALLPAEFGEAVRRHLTGHVPEGSGEPEAVDGDTRDA